ncbi:hypothetical protein JX265_000151 [Neoarthrinium moseri]|uniref:VASt domain-containing protein n=1 Tax=Neoarthrinium moseri TaxID=1658444 RepID=A0A9Q0AWK3_9PEZI|nr:hypothetical protein JX265_000151 [Neoarthrinium moseri]
MDDNGGSGGKVAKLLPNFAARRRWRKQSRESFASTTSSEDVPRGRSPHGREPSLGDDPSERPASQSHPTEAVIEENDRVGEDEEDDNISPLADEWDNDRSPVRPTVPSSHPSQIGHLTTSSPIIQAEHAPEVQHIDALANNSRDSIARSATYSVSVSSDNSAVPTRQLSGSKTGLQPPLGVSSKRSRSPAGRFKDVFKTKRTPSATPSLGSQHSDQIDKTDFASETSSRPASSSSQTGQTLAAAPDADDAGVASSNKSSRRFKSRPAIDTSNRPRTPPSSEHSAPVIVNTPPTPTDHSHPPQEGVPASQTPLQSSDPSSRPTSSASQPGGTISHRRGRSRSGSATSVGPSKLSNITLAPLTPTPENAVPPTPGGGFFSSVISAAQNAANTLSSTVSTANIGIGGKPKAPIPAESQEGDGDTTEVESSTGISRETTMAEPAVKTLGQGDLSLSHLGIQESGSAAPTPQASKFPDHVTDTRSRSESAPDAPPNPQLALSTDDLGINRPRSVYGSTGDQTPPTSVYEGKTGIHRSGSIRSAIGRRRKRGSTGGTAGTTGTGTTIGAAIAAANASVAHPHAAGSVPKLTGFAVATKRRNRDFHNLFKSVPDDDYLIEDYSCALQREILAHGRLYVSEGHLCFSSNIFGWVTTLVMSFDEIVSVEKRSTALLFKNGLMITTLHAKHVFASFTSRDSTYDLIVNIWKLGHPTLRSSLNGVSLDETGGDKTEKVDDLEPIADHSGSGSEIADDDESEEDDDDIYDEDEEDDEAPEATRLVETSLTDTEAERSTTRKASGPLATNGTSDKPANGAPAPAGGSDFPGPATHAPTECGDAASHYERLLADEIIAAPLGKVYNYMFGPASVNFMAKWLTVEQKCTDLQMEDKIGLTADNKSRAFTYIKPLNASIGPKQTKCVVTETLENIDLEKAVNVLIVTQNPDVPSGNVFSVKTKYCFSWAENNATRVQVNCTIEWTGKSWLKGPIEKGANDGQIQYCKDLFASLKAAITSRPIAANGAVGKGKKRKGKKLQETSKESLAATSESIAKGSQDWGLLEPLHGLLGPLVDIIKPILTGNVVYGLLVGLLVASWFGFGLNPRQNIGGYGPGIGFPAHPERLMAYEEVWRREESDLWDWLEERVGLHRINDDTAPIRKRVVEPRTMEERLREDRMTEREVEEAIRVTEEKLHVLKEVHDRRKPKESTYTRPTTRPETDR